MTVDHWTSVKDNPYLLKGITGVLWLCYQHLDEQARRCFAYCGIFPRRHRFERDELVKLWVAEGFIEATDEGQMEEIGDAYFGELVSTSFMQFGEKDSNMGKEYFLVHDLLHDMAEQVGGNDFFRIEDGWRREVPLDVRHLFVKTSYRFLMKNIAKQEKLRSLIILTGENSTGSEEVFEDMLKNKRLGKLRVLVIKTTTDYRGTYSLPDSIVDLKHIRYLAFLSRFSCKIVLPDAFTKLYQIQMLDFGSVSNLSIQSAVETINLSNLRHLMVKGTVANISWLRSLENLPFFVLGTQPESSYRFRELRQLSHLNKLRGKLHIAGLDVVESKDEALLANLVDKEGLRELVLEWGYMDRENEQVHAVQADVLDGLRPSEHLEELQIIGYQSEVYPNWMVGYQKRPWCAQRLVLQHCSPLRQIPPRPSFFAKLPCPSGYSFFTNLVSLTFQDCGWRFLPDYVEDLHKLTILIINQCKRIVSLGELPQSLKYLEICKSRGLVLSLAQDRYWKKIHKVQRKFIGYPRLQDSSQHPDEHGVFSSDASLPSLYRNAMMNIRMEDRDSTSGSSEEDN